MEETKVKVAVRIRPLLPKEILHNHQVCVRLVPNTAQVTLGSDRAFTFDFAFGPKAQQDEVYNCCVKPLVESLLDGYNVTVFAYGQTGSGKTYTIGGGHIVSTSDGEGGIIPRAVQDIFLDISKRHNSDFTVKASYIEVYKEELRDLLELETSSKSMHIREDEKGNTVLVGARESRVESADELMSVLEAGNAMRRTSATQVNEHSSRSHAIFTVALTRRDPDAGGRSVSSKFHLVDLAGSERVARTGNSGLRLQESAQINSGLLALGNVIRALGDPRRRGQHVPYRDAKITRLLRDSLGGNAQTLVIACLSPSSHSLHETLGSLKFADRARAIRNQPVVNWDPGQERLGELELEVRTLREALQDRGAGAGLASREEREQSRLGDLENQLARCQREALRFRALTEDASHLLRLFQGSAHNPAQACRLREWLETHQELRRSTLQNCSEISSGEQQQHITVLQLRRELKKCQDALAMDEQIFSQKDSQLRHLQDEVKRLEQENRGHLKAVLEERNRSRLQNEKLEEQQVLIERLKSDLLTSRACISGRSLEAGTLGNSALRPYSVPLINQVSRGLCNHGNADSRKVHSSPAAYSLERVMAAFRTRSQLLMAQIEEGEEVQLQGLVPGREEEEEEEVEEEEVEVQARGFSRRSLNRTWTRRNPAGTAGGRPLHRSTAGDNSCQGPESDPSESPSISPWAGSAEEHSLRRSESLNLQRLKEAELRFGHAQQQIKELALNIRLKEELIKELVKTGKDAQAVNRHYALKVAQLEQEQERKEQRNPEVQEAEQEAVQEEGVEEAQRGQQAPVGRREALRALSSHSERGRAELELSVERMRQRSGELQHLLEEEAERRRGLQAQISGDQQRIRELQLKFDQQRQILKDKMEEVTGSKKDSEMQTLEEHRRCLDQEEEKVLQQRQALAELQEELRRRDEIVSQREVVLQERSHLEMKKLRSSQALNGDLLRVSARLVALDRELEEKSGRLRGNSAEERKELGSLLLEREELDRKRRSLDLKLSEGSALTAEEEHVLLLLEEGLEALDAAIHYKNCSINGTQRLLRKSARTASSPQEGVMERLAALSCPEVKALLINYFNKVVFLREAERKLQLRCEELELQAGEQAGVVRELEAALQRLALDTDRRLTGQHREHQRGIQLLLQEFKGGQSDDILACLKAKEAKMQQLEKDLFFYKTTSRELKRKLKELVSDSLTGRRRVVREISEGAPGAPKDNGVVRGASTHQTPLDEGECSTQAHPQGAPVPVRLSRRELRPVPSTHLSTRLSELAASTDSFQEDSIELSRKTD